MAVLKLLVYIVIVVLIAVLALMFNARNEMPVVVDFIFAQSPSLSIGIWILGSFILGSVLGWAVGLPGQIGLKISSRHAGRKLARQQDELDRLKGEVAKGA